MKFSLNTIFLIAFLFIVSCNNRKQNICHYKLSELLKIDTPKVISKLINDTITEIRDKKLGNNSLPTGLYRFDGEDNLRFYGFFLNEQQYRYSEEYDANGSLISREGTPLLEYRLWKKLNDTVLFNVSIFALKKEYETIFIISNYGDTIRPKYLFKDDFYSNAKCFAFKLKRANEIKGLILFTKGIIKNTCTLEKYKFTDTTNFKTVQFQ